MKGLFYELITEACTGKIYIDDLDWPVTFNTLIYQDGKLIRECKKDNNLPILSIRDEKRFFDLLYKYIYLELEKKRKTYKFIRKKEINHVKWLIMYLFVNATEEEFANPETLLHRRIAFLEDKTFDELSDGIEAPTGNSLNDSTLKIQKKVSPTTMETPYELELSLNNKIDNKEVKYSLPTIYYGISGDTCYVYAMKKDEKEELSEEDIKYSKKINRLLYKLNKGVNEVETEEYKDFVEGNDSYYPEGNISDVTHSFVLSLSIFISLLQEKDIKNIKVVSYLPLRYLSRDSAAEKRKDQEERIGFKIRNDLIQSNLTNKLIRTFRRVTYHNKDLCVTSYPGEVDEYLSLELKPKSNSLNNQILEEIDENIGSEINGKRY